MKLSRAYTLAEIASILQRDFVGAETHEVTGINEIHMVTEGDVVFVDHPKYYDKALHSAATTVLIDQEVAAPEGKALILSPTPFDDFNKLIAHFSPSQDWNANESPRVHPTASVGPGVVIGRNVSIGAHSVIHPNVVIYDNCTIGANVTVHANTTIGGHAFYYKKKPQGYDKLLSCGGVTIADNVEIGCGCTIDKGVSGQTVIGRGSKLDNMVHVGHDTSIGNNCLIAAQVGIAGCVVIEDDVTLWGQVGVRSDITIGAKAVVLAQTGISKGLEGGKTYFGSPVAESREKLKELANTRKIPALEAELKRINTLLNEG